MTHADMNVTSADTLGRGDGARSVRLGAEPVVSLVFSLVGETKAFQGVLEEVAAECQAHDVELVVVGTKDRADASAALVNVQFITAPAGTDVRQLRSMGAQAAQGDIVAFTEDNKPVPREWIAWLASRRGEQTDADRELQPKPARSRYEFQGTREDA